MKRFLKDFFIYGFAGIIGKIASVFLMPIYTNVLTQEEYGAMALIISTQGIIGLFSNLNIHSGIARDYKEDGIDKTKLVSTGFFSILGISLSIMTIMIISQSFWQKQVLSLDKCYTNAFLFMLLTIPASSTLSYFSILTRFKRKPILYSIGTIIQLFIQITVSVTGVLYFDYGITAIFIGTFVGDLFGILYYSYINRENIAITFKTVYLKNALKFAIPTLPAILAGWIDSSFGQIIIGKYISEEELGVYSIALQLASIFTLISLAFHNVWGPYLYENYKKVGFKKELNKLFTSIVLGLTIITITISLLSKEIVLLLTNSSYLNASHYFIILCIPMCIYLLFPIATSGISISRKTKYIGFSYVFGSIINILVMFIMLPKYGVIAIPIALGVSRVTAYSALYYFSKKEGVIVLPNNVLIILVLSIAICYYINYINIGIIYRLVIIITTNILLLTYLVKYLNIKSIFTKK